MNDSTLYVGYEWVDSNPDANISFESIDAMRSSECYAKEYLADHNLPSTGLDECLTTRLAAARLQWLLGYGRKSLSGRFSINEMTFFLGLFQGELFPRDQPSIETNICHHFDIEIDEWEQSSFAPLLRKLVGLTVLERLALEDALEQAWHRALRDNVFCNAIFEQLGIELTD